MGKQIGHGHGHDHDYGHDFIIVHIIVTWNSLMLTLDLIRIKRIGQEIVPRYVDVENEKYLELAQALIEIYGKHQKNTRKELSEAIDAFLGENKDMYLGRGLNKLLEDRCEFETSATTEPMTVRKGIFEIASAAHQSGTFDRQTVLNEAARKLEITREQIESCLFADLKQNQIVCDFKPISKENLLHRYNSSLAQAILLKAQRLEIQIEEKSNLRYRQLFKAIKFHRLLYQITGSIEKGFSIVLDGPMSLFQGGQKYGLQMAMFLPALLLCKDWRLEARLQWTGDKSTQYFRLSDSDNLKSHYRDVGMYMPPELLAFEERFQKLKTDWKIDAECDFLQIGAQEICIPDYVFTHPKRQSIHLEIFGFWHKAALERRTATLVKQPKPILLAVSQKLAGERNAAIPDHDHLYYFKNAINPKEIERRLENWRK